MAKKNFYAVKKGRTPGIYQTWDECREQVDGFPGAEYKGFSAFAEAEDYLGIQGTVPAMDEQPDKPGIVPPPGEAVAYVDGSYNAEIGEYGCGVVFFFGGEEIHISRKGENREAAAMRNVAGEILGAEIAMTEAVSLGAKKLTIFHDYQGIASWCLGTWKTNKEETIAYKAYYDSLRDKLDICFEKVKGHSGDTYNDLADELAKRSLDM